MRRRGIEKLAWLISDEPSDAKIVEVAERLGETPERIMDALDVLKIRAGKPTQIPRVPWEETP